MHNLTCFPKMEILKNAKDESLFNDNGIADIERGKIDDFFHCHSLKDAAMWEMSGRFQILCKILPIFPSSLVYWIHKRKFYKKLHLIPSFAVIFLQLLIALKSRDYRYII